MAINDSRDEAENYDQQELLEAVRQIAKATDDNYGWSMESRMKAQLDAQQDVMNYITVFYNSYHLHSYLGDISPNQYEAEMTELKKGA